MSNSHDNQYEAVIGLEVHVQIRTQTKMFCSCPNQYGRAPNTLVCPVCLGYPGVMPVANRQAIHQTVLAGLMCHCRIAEYSKFDRKNYFYPDMPKNYQISQYDLPFCEGGFIEVGGTGFSGDPLPAKKIGLTRIHLEEDVGKSTHFAGYSALDFNRAGVPLMEIVSEPDMNTADEAYAYLTGLKEIMQFGGISDCDMEKGQMRCDVNISVRERGASEFGTKIEIKNLNSFRAVHRALDYEIERQIETLEDGGKMRQETRRWNDTAGATSVMRIKESAHDYRYFPEPDLMPVVFSQAEIDELRADLPETPERLRQRLVETYGIAEYDAQVLTQEKNLAEYFEEAAKNCRNAKSAANWIMTELLGRLSDHEIKITDSPIKPGGIAELVNLIEDDKISGRIGKKVFEEMMTNGKKPAIIVEEKGLRQVTDTSAIEEFVDQAMAANSDAVEQYRAGKTNAIKFLTGQVMKLSRGQANPKMAVRMLEEKLQG
ncbi:MAG: Asp-tRNA(Asn)/Glu-tRNA(Gln) amidotransferase subunit GatB [Lentisphaeria bacterium]